MTSTVSGTTAALIVAGGRGLRAGGAVPKQYAVLAGEAVLRRTLRVFLDHPAIDRVRVVIHPDDRDRYRAAIADHPKLGPPVDGGASRRESVRRGLEALADDPPARVLIHDAVRPFLSPALIGRVVGGLDAAEAVLPAVAVADTLKRADERGFTAGTVPRDRLFGAQTPQAFRFGAILDAHRRAGDLPQDFTDDAAVAEWAGIPVRLAPGEAENIKLTTAEDLEAAERRLAAGLTDIRVGSGYDVHAFGPGSGIVLGGVRIDHDRSLVGHSDADVALHALTDAVLGALAEGDIGQHFPPSDPSLRGADSARFLAFAAERVRARGGAIAHLDLAILAETPRIGPHRDAMRERIAAICGMDVGRVAVKATTNERLGFIGRQEGLAALATATVRLPWTR